MRQAIFSPYIVRLRGLVDEADTQGIVMDYFEYGSLKSFLPYLECDCWPRRVRMLSDIASGINYLHTDLTPPLAHRDIKLSNMFVDHSFTVKIGDLGLASSGTTITKSRSQAYLKGTYSHMAPEMWAGKTEDAEPSLDIYGFGISIYEFITGKSPWPPAVKLDEISGLVLSGKRPNLEFIKPDTPSEVVAMMKKCWKTDPQSRPTSPEILRSFSMLYESRYEVELLKADRVIRRKIERDASRRQQDGSSTEDSGIKSDIQESFEGLNVQDQDTTVKAASATGSSRNDSGIATMTAVDESNMTWQYKQTIDTSDIVYSCQMISPNQLAVCMTRCVKVYDVSAERSQLMYTVSIGGWKGKWIHGVAVSESLPNSMLVICMGKPYVYQCACNERTKVIKKYKIESNVKDPFCIVASANTAVIKMFSQSSLIVFKLPDFTQQSCVQIDFEPYDLSITSEYLVLMGENEMVVRSLSNVRQDMCKINPPHGWRFDSVCCRNNAREIYAACKQGGYLNEKGSVYRYRRDGVGKPKYGKPTCIIEGLGMVSYKRLSVTSDGLLAVRQRDKLKIYKLQ